MAKYKIEGAPKGKAYVNIVDDGPRLVTDGTTVHLEDTVIPSDWMVPLDAAARAAVERRDRARETVIAGELAASEAE
jgi:hypothetical protein